MGGLAELKMEILKIITKEMRAITLNWLYSHLGNAVGTKYY